MINRVFLLMLFLRLTFSTPLGHAETWEQVYTNSWIDIDSITSTQTEFGKAIKVTGREYIKDGKYYSTILLINKDVEIYSFESIELYNINGKFLGKTSVDLKDQFSWMSYYGINNKVIQEILKRTAER
jgi:hypothetical protein